MIKRLILLCLIASVFVVAPAAPASACSCVPLDPAKDLARFDIAFVAVMTERPSASGEFVEHAPYVFEVEEWVKGDLGTEVVVFAPNQGSACGFEVPEGKRVGVLANVVNGQPRGGLCSTVDADLLLAGDTTLTIDGTGAPAFLLAGYDGPARWMLLDAAGGLLTIAGGSGEALHAFDVCPGAESFVELVNDHLVVRSTADLREVRRIDLKNLTDEVGAQNIWCRDTGGDEIWIATEEWSEASGNMLRVFKADEGETPLIEGNFGWLEIGDAYAVGGQGWTGDRIWRIDLASSEQSMLHEIPVESGDSQPRGRGWMNPEGLTVMVTEWRWHDDDGGSTRLYLYDLDTGDLVWESGAIATADGIGWIDDHTFAVSSYPDIESEAVDYILVNTANSEFTHLNSFAGWMALRAGERLLGVTGAKLLSISLVDGTTTELRLLPSEGHRLIAILDPDTTTQTETATTVTNLVEDPPSQDPTPEAIVERSVDAGPRNWAWIGLVVALMAVAGVVIRARGSRPRS